MAKCAWLEVKSANTRSAKGVKSRDSAGGMGTAQKRYVRIADGCQILRQCLLRGSDISNEVRKCQLKNQLQKGRHLPMTIFVSLVAKMF